MISKPNSQTMIDFLTAQGWRDATRSSFNADFSSRHYARLTHADGRRAVLMQAEADQHTHEFVALAKIIRDCGLHTPDIYAADSDNGCVLMEDFGTRPVGRLIDNGASFRHFAIQAVEALAKLHANFHPKMLGGLTLPLFDGRLFVEQAELFLTHYIPFAHNRLATDDDIRLFRHVWTEGLTRLDALPQSLLLRDFMPDNWMALDDGELGMLDFQDAGIGPIAYDLASMAEVVRRDGGFDLMPDLVARYRQSSGTPVSPEELMEAVVILSAQRHTRILGIVAAQVQKGKSNKASYFPRIVDHLRRIMHQPALRDLARWMEPLLKEHL